MQAYLSRTKSCQSFNPDSDKGMTSEDSPTSPRAVL